MASCPSKFVNVILKDTSSYYPRRHIDTMLRILAVVALAFQAINGLTVTQQPANSAVEIGNNVTIACMVSNKATGESVQWKHKDNSSNTFNAITFDTNVLGDAAKYAVVSTYNLTVINAATTDEGTYRCTAATTDYDAYLTVADLPTTVAITWSADPNSGDLVNLTCTATNGRPAPDLRWTINGIDQTGSILETSALSSSGYGNSVSNLPLTLTTDYNDQLAVCYVAYDGWNDAKNATLVMQINGSPVLQVSTFMTLLVAFAIFM